jgi:hypothetical protein
MLLILSPLIYYLLNFSVFGVHEVVIIVAENPLSIIFLHNNLFASPDIDWLLINACLITDLDRLMSHLKRVLLLKSNFLHYWLLVAS